MTALASELMVSDEQWTRQGFPLRQGVKAWKGALMIGDPTSATVVPGVASANQIFLGRCNATIDNTNGSGPTTVTINLLKERTLTWCANDGSITAANLFSTAYIADDNTVTATSSAHSAIGIIMAVSATDGVLVQLGSNQG